MKKVSEHKHLGIILDSKLSFSAHIKSDISKTRKGIGLLKYLSKYLPRHTLNELYMCDPIWTMETSFIIFLKSMRIQSKYHFAKVNGKVRVCSVFCCFSRVRYMEGNISREAVHRTWLGVTEFPKVVYSRVPNNRPPPLINF